MDEATSGHEALGEGDLLAYLEGQAAPALAAHIAGCPRCQADLADLRAAEALLADAVARAGCPSADQLLAHAAGLLAPADAAPLAAHVAACPDCRAELALIADPPAPSPLGRLARAGLRLIRAALLPAAAPATALRGGEPRRALYAAGPYRLLVAVAPPAAPGGPAEIEGQLLDAPHGPAVAWLARGDEAPREEPLDELGFFAFDRLAPGRYSLAVDIGDERVLIEEIAVP